MCVYACTYFPRLECVSTCICLCLSLSVSVCLCVCVHASRAHIVLFQLREQMLGIVNTGAKSVQEAPASNENVSAVS